MPEKVTVYLETAIRLMEKAAVKNLLGRGYGRVLCVFLMKNESTDSIGIIFSGLYLREKVIAYYLLIIIEFWNENLGQ